MQKVLLAISLVFIGVNSYAAELNIPNVLKTGDASNGSSLVATCAACHGNDGNSVNTDWPSLAGQNQKYLYDQLVYFVNGEDVRGRILNRTEEEVSKGIIEQSRYENR